mgnify:CR=1 FL=1
MGKTMQAILEKELLRGEKSRYGIYRLRRSEAYSSYIFCSLEVLRAADVTPKKEMSRTHSRSASARHGLQGCSR